MVIAVQNERWDLEEIPYETGDPAGGWYLHFDPTGENTEDVLYMSKAHVTEVRARIIAKAPEMYALLEKLAREGVEYADWQAMRKLLDEAANGV